MGSAEYQVRTTAEMQAAPHTFHHTLRTVAARIDRWDMIILAGVVAVFARAWLVVLENNADLAATDLRWIDAYDTDN